MAALARFARCCTLCILEASSWAWITCLSHLLIFVCARTAIDGSLAAYWTEGALRTNHAVGCADHGEVESLGGATRAGQRCGSTLWAIVAIGTRLALCCANFILLACGWAGGSLSVARLTHQA
eukprot:4808739-Prymnesium_polylepis.1